MAYKFLTAGYLVKDNKVFLVHHKGFNKWTPPGGHIEENETPDQALVREWKEELGLDINIIPAQKSAFAGDSNSTPIPMPFHIDLEREGFEVPHIGYFFFVSLKDSSQSAQVLKTELENMGWFTKEELQQLPTFDQVKALSNYALTNYPK